MLKTHTPFMKDWKKTLIPPDASIIETIEAIGQSSMQICLVVDADNRLLGTVTDGDIRRGILGNIVMDDAVSKIMHKEFVCVSIHDDRTVIAELMQRKEIRHIPVVDDEQRVVDLKLYSQIVMPEPLSNQVVIMAGGLGTRLRPLTDDFPKPLLKVGTTPLLETTIKNFQKYGFSRFVISVNYKADMVENYFGDGSKWGIDISYLREKKQLGTAGALSLLSKRPSKPFFVINGDLLTKINLEQLLDFHANTNANATMCVREYEFQVPYGVVKIKGHRLQSIEEKPVQNFFVNAGIYVLEPEVLDLIPQNTFFNMTSLFEKLIEVDRNVSVFPIHEYWIDIGQIKDFEQANSEYNKKFLDYL